MSKFNFLKTSFKSGEWSARALGRRDAEDYREACEQMLNWFPYKIGGAIKRPGSVYRNVLTDLGTPDPGSPNRGLRIIPFVFNRQDTSLILLNLNSLMAGAAEPVFIFNSDGTRVDTLDVTIAPDIKAAAPYALDPAGFVYAQIGDVVFITHSSGEFQPIYVARVIDPDTGDITWEVQRYLDSTPLGFGQVTTPLKRPYRDVNVEPYVLVAISVAPLTVIEMRVSGGGAPVDFFNPGHVGAYMRVQFGSEERVVRIDSLVNSARVNVTVVVDGAVEPAPNDVTDIWREQSWSDFRGWPRTVVAFEQRLIWGGNEAEKNTFWGSLSGNVFHMMQRRLEQDILSGSDTSGINYFIGSAIPDENRVPLFNNEVALITDPFTFRVASTEFNPICWMAASKVLHIGTLGGEYIATGGDEILSVESVSIRQNTSIGGDYVQPVRIDDQVLYVSKDGRRVYNHKFNDNNGSFISNDITAAADHLYQYGTYDASQDGPVTARKIRELIHHQSRSIVFGRTSLNDLIGVTYSPNTEAIGWFKVELPGVRNVWSCAYLPDSSIDGFEDTLYMVVEREIDGTIEYYLESIGVDFEGETLASTTVFREDIPIYLDSARLQTGTDLDILTGFDHLEGETVGVTANGLFIGEFTVNAGNIALGQTYDGQVRFLAGLKYTATLDTADVEAGGDFGFSEGAIQRIDRVIARLYKTFGLKVGNPLTGQVYPLKIPSTDVYTGDARIETPNSSDRIQKIRIVSEDPYPAHVVSLAMRGVTYD